MGLENAIEKLDKYFKRLEGGKAKKIKPRHVEKMLRKLEVKAADLKVERDEASKESKQISLQRKLDLTLEQHERARWLLEQIGDP